jgi:outer membrane protein assembly factor BamB
MPSIPPTETEVFANWPRFRGPLGSAIVTFNDIRQQWDASTNEGILWKSTVELPGVGSPIVWLKRIFLTGATAEKREIYCFDADDGKLLWTRSVADRKESQAEIEVEATTGFAAPTPATDGTRVYAIFASGDLVAFDFDGNELWSHAFGVLDNAFGHASSLATYGNLVIVQLDQGKGEANQSRLIAIQGATGEIVWEVQREVPESWATPIVIEFEDSPRIITAADPWVIANAVDDGRELWRAECLSGDVGPSPVYFDGMIYVANDGAMVAAIQDGGQGDVTESHVLWRADYGMPDICSPLVADELLLLVPSYGGLAAYKRHTGGEEPLWEQDLDGMLMASPTVVGNHVYLIGEEGRGWVIRLTDSGFEQVAENDIGERCLSSPAFQPGRIYLRGENHLFCIGNQ